MNLSDLFKLARSRNSWTSYKIGLLQTKAYRALKAHTTTVLKPFQLSTVEWALLGILHEQQAGIRSMDVADLLGVEQPFITVLLKKLSDRELVHIEPHASDRRVKLVTLTPSGRDFVVTTEEVVLAGMKPLLGKLKSPDIATYLTVLQSFAEHDNGQE
jgi:DNA-binding MarR family transcriptional regulator